jgi:predicted MFS family arabinose efflux permease
LNAETVYSTRRLAWSLWLPFACIYFISYGIRNVNAVLVPELTREFGLSASQLGLLTSVFFLAFVAVQLPGGLLMDRFGPRRVNATLVLVSAAGCALFAIAESFVALTIARVLIGLGMSLGLMASVKAFTQWFPLERLPLAGGLLLTFGGLGGIAAILPVEWALHVVSWRVVFSATALICLAAAGFLFFVAPDKREAGANASLRELLGGFGTVFRNPTFWRLVIASALIGSPHQAMQALWIGPWLRDVAGLARDAEVAAMAAFMLASTIGFVIVAAMVDQLIRRGLDPLTIYKWHSALAVSLLAIITLINGPAVVWLWGLLYLIGTSGMVVFMNLQRIFPPELTGRVSTATNCLVFAAVFLSQWLFGVILDQWPVVDGRYAVPGYQAGLGLLVGLQIAVLLWLAPLRLPPLRARSQ